MNMTQIINEAARQLSYFSKEEQTEENAQIELYKVIEYNSDLQANRDISSNLGDCISKVIRRASNY